MGLCLGIYTTAYRSWLCLRNRYELCIFLASDLEKMGVWRMELNDEFGLKVKLLYDEVMHFELEEYLMVAHKPGWSQQVWPFDLAKDHPVIVKRQRLKTGQLP